MNKNKLRNKFLEIYFSLLGNILNNACSNINFIFPENIANNLQNFFFFLNFIKESDQFGNLFLISRVDFDYSQELLTSTLHKFSYF